MKYLNSIALSLLLSAGCASKIVPNSFTKPLPLPPTCAHLTLEAERELGASEEEFRKLDLFLDKTCREIKTKSRYSLNEAEDILRIINKEVSLVFTNYKIGDYLFDSFRTKNFDCERSSMLFMAVGERLNLPIIAVYAKGGCARNGLGKTNLNNHVFVRWKFDNLDYNHYNWETTTKQPLSDDHYESQYLTFTELNKKEFREWCISTRFDWFANCYGKNYDKARKESYDLIKNLDKKK